MHENHGAGTEPGDGERHDEVCQRELNLHEREACGTKTKVQGPTDGDGHDEGDEVGGVFGVDAYQKGDSTQEFDESGYVGKEHGCWEAHLCYARRKAFHAWHLTKQFTVSVVYECYTEHEAQEEQTPVRALLFGAACHHRK